MGKTFVTGGAGFLGANLIANLVSRERNVVAFMRKTSDTSFLRSLVPRGRFEKFVNIKVYENSLEIPDVLSSSRPDNIIHVAAVGKYEHKTEDIPALIQSNVEFGTMLLEGAHLLGKKNGVPIPMVFCGSYFQHAGEQMEYKPNCLYAASKNAFESFAHYYSKILGNPVIGIKFYDIYGLRDNRQRIVDLIFSSLNSKRVVKMSEGEQKLRLINVDDAVSAICYALSLVTKESNIALTYAACGREYQSLKKLVAIIEGLSQMKANIEWGALPYREQEIFNPVLLQQMPGWMPKVALEKGLLMKLRAWKGEQL